MEDARLVMIRQQLDTTRVDDIDFVLEHQLENLKLELKPGSSIAIAVGSRGIANLKEIVRAAVSWLIGRGCKPFVIPAMGSHGGAAAEGQRALLESYGVTEEYVGAPVVSSMEVVELPGEGLRNKVYMDKHAFQSDGVIVINRIKPHTDYHGPFESGLMKMCVIGLGKHKQALEIHSFGVTGLREMIVPTARQVLKSGKILLGIGVVENSRGEVAMLRALRPEEIEREEPLLLEKARQMMPKLPVDSIDLLIIDQFGKDISGVGLDPNIIGRIGIAGHPEPGRPQIKAILLADLTGASHGNALGMGLADVITRRVYEKIDFQATYENAVTSSFLERAKMPIVAESDRQAAEYALRLAVVRDLSQARIMRIKNTLQLEELYVSPPLLAELEKVPGVEITAREAALVQPDGHFPEFEPVLDR